MLQSQRQQDSLVHKVFKDQEMTFHHSYITETLTN